LLIAACAPFVALRPTMTAIQNVPVLIGVCARRMFMLQECCRMLYPPRGQMYSHTRPASGCMVSCAASTTALLCFLSPNCQEKHNCSSRASWCRASWYCHELGKQVPFEFQGKPPTVPTRSSNF
jgi:hypothetical protein